MASRCRKCCCPDITPILRNGGGEQSVIRTAKNRPDLLARADLTEEEKTLARKILEETGKA